MNQQTQQLLTDEIQAEMAQRYGLAPAEVKPLKAFENFMYEFERGGRGYILRLAHSSHRTPELIQGEAEWMNYLAQNGVACPEVVLSKKGQLVEIIPAGDGSHFMATAFTKAPGRHATTEDLTPALFEEWGKLLGKIHRLTKNYAPSSPAVRRYEWHADPYYSRVAEILPAEDAAVAAKINQFMAELRQLPTTPDSYGLIHTDAHLGNFFVDNGHITLFDFDDSAYMWFIHDLAMVIFYTVSRAPAGQSREEYAQFMWQHLWAGYSQENQLTAEWVARLPLFLKLREMILYVAIYSAYGEGWRESPLAGFMTGRADKILQDVPVLNITFAIP